MKRTLLILAALSPLALAACDASPDQPDSYLPFCAGALAKVQVSTGELNDAHLTPGAVTVLDRHASYNGHARVQCGLFDGSKIGEVTFDYISDSPSDVIVQTAAMDDRVVYLSKTAADALRAAGAKHPHHHHHQGR